MGLQEPAYRAQTEALVALSDPTKKGLHSPRPPIQPNLAWRWEQRTRPLLMESRIRRSRAVAEAARQTANPVEAIRYLEEQAAGTRDVNYESHQPVDAEHAISYLQGQATYFDIYKDATQGN